MPITTVIFDMDGVIADTQRLHAQAEHALLRQRGIHLTPEEITHRFSGVSGHEMFSTIFQEHNHSGSVDEIVTEKRAVMMGHAASDIVPISGVQALIKRLKDAGLTLAVASASGPDFIEKVLESVQVRQHFDALASSREVARGKPAPDVFLLAAKKVGVVASACMVIEDGISGMQGARAAGMACIALVEPHRLQSNTNYPADVVVERHDQITLELIQSLG
ncbi:MAG: HAD family phosphatase [Candidatus Kerfeldbacteria bacterium]|nr:HAD family phosphatase [Candidatus Kerfeldbacteria bacterium]